MSLLGHRPCLRHYTFVCRLMDGVFKLQHLARGRSSVSITPLGRKKINTRRLGGDRWRLWAQELQTK